MDPAVYARAHGVQSESNKVTVTRVACGEIMYRRAVDTYRRDMKYKLNNLRKEQKRLRVCMRGYRQKLRQSHESDAHSKDKKRRRIGSEVKHALENDDPKTSTKSQTGLGDGDLSTNGDSKLRSRYSAVSAPVTDEKVPRMEESTRSCYPALSQNSVVPNSLSDTIAKNETQELQLMQEFVTTGNPRLIENVGRTVRKGSGKIGALSKQVHVSIADSELEDDAFSVISDSSDEEERAKNEDDHIDIVTFRNGRFIREITPLTLMARKSAYFKPAFIGVDQDGTDGHGVSVYNESTSTFVDKSVDSILHASERFETEERGPTSEPAPPTCPGLPLRSLVVKSDQTVPNAPSSSENKVTTDGSDSIRTSNKRKAGVSFNDIIKIQVSNNTKQLFSLVDRLAKSNGIALTPEQRQTKQSLTRNDPRESAAMMRRTQAGKQGWGIPDLVPHDSVYYAIKYGYISDAEDLSKLPGLSWPASTENRERVETITTDDFPASSHSNSIYDSRALTNTMSGLSLHQDDTTTRGPPLEQSYEDRQIAEDGTEPKLAPLVTGQKVKQRDRRRSSILEASKFMTAARGRRNTVAYSELLEKTKQERELFSRPRRESIKPQHVEVSTDHKEAWQSAFRRIKIIHTLANLSHLI